jgi:predicted DNA-binding mobile mystery protein A
MSTAQLAQRLGIKQPSVVAVEQSEVKGTIELATLRRVAEALDCTVIYALVPNKPLESMVRERAKGVARRRLAAIEHSMLLEDQAASGKDLEARIEKLAGEIDLRLLWED